MAKFNVLAEIEKRDMKPNKIIECIIMLMPFDDDLSAFIIEQAKFMLFTGMGIGKPSDDELTRAVYLHIVSISLNLRGATVSYQYFLDKGLSAYLEMVGKMLYEENVG